MAGDMAFHFGHFHFFCLFDFERSRSCIFLEDLKFKFVLLSHKANSIIEITDLLVNLPDNYAQNDQHNDEEENISDHDEVLGRGVVEGSLSQRKIDVSEHNGSVHHECKQSGDEVDVHIQVLLIRPDCEEVVKQGKLQVDQQILKNASEKYSNDQHLLQQNEQTAIPGVPKCCVNALVELRKSQKLPFSQVLLPTLRILLYLRVQDINLKVGNTEEGQDGKIDKHVSNNPFELRKIELAIGGDADELSAVKEEVEAEDEANIDESAIGKDIQNNVEFDGCLPGNAALKDKSDSSKEEDDEKRKREALKDEPFEIWICWKRINRRDKQEAKAQIIEKSSAQLALEHQQHVELAVFNDYIPQQCKITQQISHQQHKDSICLRNVSLNGTLISLNAVAAQVKSALSYTQWAVENKCVNLKI